MLTKRVIPCLDVKDGRVVKGVNFVGLRDAGDPIELARAYDEQKADEVIFLDITATSDDRATTVELASHASAELHLPYCVGGGFRSVADIRKMIAAGADKVSVNSAAVANPQLITDAARAFGTQAILCAIDAKAVPGNPNKWEVYVAGGRKNTHIDAIEWAREAARRGAGEILLTSMDRDGSRDGFDCHLTRSVARAVDIPVIATVTREDTDIAMRLESGASILNIACGYRTPEVVRKIREQFRQVPLIASGGKTNETVRETILAGANAITYTPPSVQDLFKTIMAAYRE